jgi:glycosyltransferase involved in cell wall biosynthesis
VRIGFLTRRFWPAVGGIEAHARLLAGELAGEHDVTVVAEDAGPRSALRQLADPRPAFAPYADGRVSVLPLRVPYPQRVGRWPGAIAAVPGLRRHAYRDRVRAVTMAADARAAGRSLAPLLRDLDVLHVLGGGGLAATGVEAGRRAGVPVVVSPFAHPGQWDDDAASGTFYRRAAAVVAQLPVEAELHRSLGVPEDRITVCGPCVQAPEEADGDALRAGRGIDGPLVLFLGVRRPYKGADLVLAAAERLGADAADVTWAFVGPGPALPAAPGVAGRVVDAGAVDGAEKAAWLRAADLLCLPSRFESFGIVVVEAWWARTAVVTSDIPALRELVVAAGGGEAVPPTPAALAAALAALLRDPERRAALAAAGHERAREHAPAAIAARHATLYREVLR